MTGLIRTHKLLKGVRYSPHQTGKTFNKPVMKSIYVLLNINLNQFFILKLNYVIYLITSNNVNEISNVV